MRAAEDLPVALEIGTENPFMAIMLPLPPHFLRNEWH